MQPVIRKLGTVDRVALAILRAFLIGTASLIAGAGFGVLAAVGAGLGFESATAAFFGAALGLLMSPLPMWALWSGRIVSGSAVILLSTAATAFLSGVALSSAGSPLLSMPVAGLVYAGSCLGFGAWSRLKLGEERQLALGCCASCGYSLSGLPGAARCPECGAPVPQQ